MLLTTVTAETDCSFHDKKTFRNLIMHGIGRVEEDIGGKSIPIHEGNGENDEMSLGGYRQDEKLSRLFSSAQSEQTWIMQKLFAQADTYRNQIWKILL